LGPEYELNEKIAGQIKSISIALMYGPAFPILYPITLVVMACEYVRERLMLCYYYREPTTYD